MILSHSHIHSNTFSIVGCCSFCSGTVVLSYRRYYYWVHFKVDSIVSFLMISVGSCFMLLLSRFASLSFLIRSAVTLKEFVVAEYAKGYICSFVFSHRVLPLFQFPWSIVPFQRCSYYNRLYCVYVVRITNNNQ